MIAAQGLSGSRSPRWLLSGVAALCLGLAPLAVGAAGTDQTAAAPARAPSPIDPYESFNRSIYSFNDALDVAVLKPVAQAYRKVVPEPVRTGVDNFLGNLGDVWSAVNHLLQGKVEGATRMTMRVATNTVFGLGGLFDPATDIGLERQQEDFGQTLGHWGLKPGPYLVLPILGPSDVRDALATPINVMASPSAVAQTTAQSTGITVMQVVSGRAGLLDAGRMLDDIALDKYSFLRDAYLARRRSLVYDGNPPDEPEVGDPAEPANAAAASAPLAEAPVAPAAAASAVSASAPK